MISIHKERLQIAEAGWKQNESIWNHFKSLAHFSTQFTVKESFKLLLAIEVKTISWLIMQQFGNNRKTLNFRGR